MNNTAATRLSTEPTWEHSFLEWFSKLPSVEVFESTRILGGLSYYQFVARFKQDSGRVCGTFGRSHDRGIAAIKCAAEYVERKAMMDYFSAYRESVPRELHTSNGWAVHQSASLAKQAAVNEALERHLLLKSYIAFGWRGFVPFETIESPEIKIQFLTSVYRIEGKAAGLVAASVPHYPGVSFGYCVGAESDLSKSHFWESAIYEAVDRILTLNGESIDLALDPQSWMLKAAKEFLEEPFDKICLMHDQNLPIVESEPKLDVEVFNLTDRWGLNFPLYAAFAHGPEVIPLYPTTELWDESKRYLLPILKANGLSIDHLATRHPIL